MHSQNFSHSRSDHSDFNAALKRASQAHSSRPRDRSAKLSAARRFEEYDPYHNRNISSIVSKITDEGPANVHPIKTKPQKKNVSSRVMADNLSLAEDTYTPSAPLQSERENITPQPFNFNEADFGQETRESGSSKYAVLYHSVLFLLITVVAVIGYLLFQLTLKADEFSQALHLNERQVVLESGSQKLSPEMLPRLNSLGETLADIKAEMQGIKISQQTANEKQNTKTPVPMLQRAMPIPIKGGELGVLKKDLKRIHTGTYGSKVRQTAGQDQHPTDKSLSSKGEIKSEEQDDVPGRLAVNLVSLTDRNKAHAAYDRLLQAGVAPLIEEVVVDGRTIYRLSVDGFETRESAQVFISNVSEKYGFDGGWIRQH